MLGAHMSAKAQKYPAVLSPDEISHLKELADSPANPALQQRAKYPVVLSPDEVSHLKELADSPANPALQQRAKILLLRIAGATYFQIEDETDATPQTIAKTIKKCSMHGMQAALEDGAGTREPCSIPREAKAWIIFLVCQPPLLFDDAPRAEKWTITALVNYVHAHCKAHDFPMLAGIQDSTIWAILNDEEMNPPRTRYFLEEMKLDLTEQQKKNLENPFLLFRRTDWIVDWVSDHFGEGYRASRLCGLGFVSYRGQSDMGDAPIHMSPKCSRSKNPEGVRKVRSKKYNSVSLLSGMDLRTGDLLGVLLETQECSDFTEFLKKADRHYDKKLTINIVLDDEAICQTKAILDYLSKQPKQRFKFITSPRCTFLLNLIDTLFGKMASQLLRTARFKSKQDLICHIEEWLVEINRQPLVCYWKSGRTENIERVLLSL